MRHVFKAVSGIVLTTLLAAGVAQAEGGRMYQVTVTNLTKEILFTPIMAATHEGNMRMFMPGAEPSMALANMAEGGDTSGLPAMLDAYDTANSEGPLGPGESVTLMVKAHGKNRFLSVAAMLLPTNDGFFAVNGVRLPRGGKHLHLMSPAFDAGSEDNDELCASIPGPQCGGSPFSEGLGEGYVYIHPGIQGVGDLAPAQYDWNNPVALITVHKMK